VHNGSIFNFSQILAQLTELNQNLLTLNKYIRLEGIGYDSSYKASTPEEYAFQFENSADLTNKKPEKEVKTASTSTCVVSTTNRATQVEKSFSPTTSTSTCVVSTTNRATQVEKSFYRRIIDYILNYFSQ